MFSFRLKKDLTEISIMCRYGPFHDVYDHMYLIFCISTESPLNIRELFLCVFIWYYFHLVSLNFHCPLGSTTYNIVEVSPPDISSPVKLIKNSLLLLKRSSPLFSNLCFPCHPGFCFSVLTRMGKRLTFTTTFVTQINSLLLSHSHFSTHPRVDTSRNLPRT